MLFSPGTSFLTDADWNELTDIEKERLVAALGDDALVLANRLGRPSLVERDQALDAFYHPFAYAA